MSATRHRDLHTGRSVWYHQRLPAIPRHTLTRDATADAVVVGSGISGAMIAETLSDAGLRVLIVDRRPAISGSTSASTSLMQYEIDTPLTHLSRDVGADAAIRIWRRSKLALDALRERIAHLAIDADVMERDSLYLDGTLLNPAGLREEAAARRAAGFEVTSLEPRQVAADYGITRRHGLLGHGNLAADPRRLTAGFLKAALRRRARLLTPVDITAVDADASGVHAATSQGPTLRARHIVFATGYELLESVPQRGHAVASTYAIATRPQRSRLWRSHSFIWEASMPYLYLRVGPDGRIICGGEDEPFDDAATRDALLPQKTATLERKLSRLLPYVDPRADYTWCGSFGASEKGTPSIGPVPGMPNCHAVLGFGGNGITFSALAAQMLRNQLSGRGDPDSDLFALRK